MPLQKLQFKPGVDRENTRYTAEGQWYETDKVRFRRGMPEKIGGWQRVSANTYLGVARSLLNWITLGKNNLVSVGTNIKYYPAKKCNHGNDVSSGLKLGHVGQIGGNTKEKNPRSKSYQGYPP